MSADERPVGEDDLQAFVDGRLAPGRLALVEAFLAAHPAVAGAAATDRDIRDRLRARLLPLVAAPIPGRLRVASVLAGLRARRRQRVGAAMAAVLCLTVGGAGGWVARDRAQADPRASRPVEAAVAAFKTYSVEIAHPVEVRADQQGHLVQWLSRRLDRTVVVPDLAALGFRLMGGRLLPGEARPAALLMYDDEGGQRLVLYSRPGPSRASPGGLQAVQDAEVAAVLWTSEDQTFVVAARIDATRLRALAQAAEAQIAGAPDRRL